jgi:hypothetical protein
VRSARAMAAAASGEARTSAAIGKAREMVSRARSAMARSTSAAVAEEAMRAADDEDAEETMDVRDGDAGRPSGSAAMTPGGAEDRDNSTTTVEKRTTTTKTTRESCSETCTATTRGARLQRGSGGVPDQRANRPHSRPTTNAIRTRISEFSTSSRETATLIAHEAEQRHVRCGGAS